MPASQKTATHLEAEFVAETHEALLASLLLLCAVMACSTVDAVSHSAWAEAAASAAAALALCAACQLAVALASGPEAAAAAVFGLEHATADAVTAMVTAVAAAVLLLLLLWCLLWLVLPRQWRLLW